MADSEHFETAPQPYPARPHWTGDFHRLEAVLFSGRKGAETRALDFALAHVPSRTPARVQRSAVTDRYVQVQQLPDMPSLQIDLSSLDD